MKVINEQATKVAFKNAQIMIDEDGVAFVVEDDSKEGIIQTELTTALGTFFPENVRYDIVISAKIPMEI